MAYRKAQRLRLEALTCQEGWGSGPCRQMVALGGSYSPAQTLSAISGGHWAATACTPKREGEMNVGCELSGSLLRGVLQGWVAEGTMCPKDTVLLTDQSAQGSSEQQHGLHRTLVSLKTSNVMHSHPSF